MWFVFPQLAGLGRSETAQFYAIQNLNDAQAYLAHDVLGPRLKECAKAILAVDGRTADQIFGPIDGMKLHSSLTLFEHVAGPGSVFSQALEKYFSGNRDVATLQLLGLSQ